MKRNDPHHWTIQLCGRHRVKKISFIGRLDQALAEADELESAVPFTVIKYIVTRGIKAAPERGGK